jgi:hypothetical protein
MRTHYSSRSNPTPEIDMGIMSFFKEAGEKLFGHKEAEAAAQQAQATPDNADLQAAAASANAEAGAAIEAYIAAKRPTKPPRRRSCCAAATCTAWRR